ncbi:MAG: hypothetical protein DI582_09655 [Azospirillum brasilense]|nr:MAG: hypothetical protein DI582_09655 [Azospirillum brasilense]
MQRIGIIGFGFSGLMLTTHLVRRAASGTEIYIMDPVLNARGMAYGTTYREHLLNVRAHNMSAFAEEPLHFVAWLAQHHPHYTPQDFVPRQIFGEYLGTVWQQTQALAAERHVSLKLVPSVAVAMAPQPGGLAITTERGDAIAVDRIVLATGNEPKTLPAPAGRMLQTPWVPGALAEAAKEAGPILLIGTGLTAVDTILALRAEGYSGEIIAYSRHGLLPQPHRDYGPAEALAASEIESLQSVRQWAAWLRRKTHAAADWRAVIDGLRPFTQQAWAALRTQQQQIFLRHAASFWGVHRHRMAPQVAQQLRDDAKLTVMNRAQFKASNVTPTLTINCTGSELNLRRSAAPLLKSLLAQRMIEPHANGVGLAADAKCRAWGEAYPHLFCIGPLMTGQLLESIAVPELRVQAQQIAEEVCRS